MVIVVLHLFNDATTQYIHGHLLEPAAGLLRQHDHHIRSVLFSQPFADRGAKRLRREILVFDINEIARAFNCIEIKLFDLVNRSLALISGHGAGDGHGFIADANVDAGRPRRVFAGGGLGNLPTMCP